jgi:exopolysaccharide biosynthesis polyprenyl glycosylphosphotransferase
MLIPLSRSPYFARVAAAIGADGIAVAIASAAAWVAVRGAADVIGYFQMTFGSGLVLLGALAVAGRYDGRAESSDSRARRFALLGTLLGFGAMLAVARSPIGRIDSLAPAAPLAGALALANLAACEASARASRWLFKRYEQRILIIGASDLGIAIARELEDRPRLGLRLVGFLSDEDGGLLTEYARTRVRVLGPVHHLEKVVEELGVHRIVVTSKSRSELFPADELLTYKIHGRLVESGVAFYENLTGKIYIRGLRPSYLVFADGFRVGLSTRVVKRAFDVAIAGLGLLAAAIVLAACAIAIKLDSPGPVFFRQKRVGRRGKLFAITKLRTMTHNAEAACGPRFSRRGDVRITRVGKVLRRSRLDELPQLWNVLRGDMTLVGPRPERPEFVGDLVRDLGYFRLRTAMRPGLTGWAQVNNGYAAEARHFEEKLSYDLFYMKHRSLALDFLVMLRTIREVVLFKGV